MREHRVAGGHDDFLDFLVGGVVREQGAKRMLLNPKQASSPRCVHPSASHSTWNKNTALVCCKLLFENDYVPRQKHWTLSDGQDSLDPE